MKIPAIALAFAVLLLVIVAASVVPALAQSGTAAPANVQAVDGANPGAVTVSWNAVDGAAFYRIGWVASDSVAAAQAADRPWLDAFAFTDVTNRGQTVHTLTDLAPGAQYAFIIGSVDNRFGAAHWSEWTFLMLAEAPATSCPTAPPMPTPTATPTPTVAPTPMLTSTRAPTPTLRPTPTGTGDYDADKDGLIEISNLAQLNAIRADLEGDGISPAPAYAAAFPNAMPGMGCPDAGCTGYELVADLDFDTNGNGEADAGDAYWNDGAGWAPIGDREHQFTADFDGNNHIIANLYINRRETFVGLFGYARGSAIKQVGLASATVSSGGDVGSLVGIIANGAISGSYATGSVAGNGFVGGLVGNAHNSTISDSYATGNVPGSHYVGGLVGHTYGSAISGSYATGSVSGGYYVGGLVGHTHEITISNSYATGNVSGTYQYVGGLVGRTWDSNIRSSYATGSVSGDAFVGGLAGHTRSSDINASYATGSVSGGDYVGGLVGIGYNGSINASYVVGRVSTTVDTFHIGGLTGHNAGGEIAASYWDTQTTGQADSYGGIGKTTAELQSPTGATGIYAHWNTDHWDFGTSTQYSVLKHGGLDPAAQRRQLEGSQ